LHQAVAYLAHHTLVQQGTPLDGDAAAVLVLRRASNRYSTRPVAASATVVGLSQGGVVGGGGGGAVAAVAGVVSEVAAGDRVGTPLATVLGLR